MSRLPALIACTAVFTSNVLAPEGVRLAHTPEPGTSRVTRITTELEFDGGASRDQERPVPPRGWPPAKIQYISIKFS